MKLNAVCVVAALVLPACGNQPGETANNSSASADEITLKPGKYQVEFVREVMVPAEPSEPMRQTDQVCLSADDVKHPEVTLLPGLEDCTQKDIKIGKGEVSAKMICNIPAVDASGVGFEVRGTYDSEGADLTGDATLPEGTLRETRTFRRQGDC